MAQDRGEKTEQPTGKKLDKARKEGSVPRTQEMASTMAIGAFLGFAMMFGPEWVDRLRGMAASTFSSLARPDLSPAELIVVLGSTLIVTGTLVAGPLGAMTAAGLAGNLVQGRPPLTTKPFKPKFSKFNPVNGVKKIFSPKSASELVRTILKMVLFTIVAYSAASSVIRDGIAAAPGAEGTVAAFAAVARKMLLWIAILAAGITVLDLLFQRWNFTREQKMTKKEVKDERKETEGDPLIKMRIRQKQMAMARSRMMADVPDATVVVTNPTHYAVALRFVPGEMDVPKVLAKGRAKLAQKIREVAAEHRIPIVQDPPLARAIYKAVPVGGEIPPALFRAVAEVLAMILGGGKRRRASRPTRPGPGREVRP